MAQQESAIVSRARACVGARFRVQGRDPAFGLDCVGLAAQAFGVAAEGGYALRGGDADAIAQRIAAAGLTPVAAETAGAGDLVLIEAGPRQFHLAVLTGTGFVHAHAGLRRVVETPGRPAAVLRAWRGKDS